MAAIPKLPPSKPRRRPLTRLSPKLHVPMTASEQLQWENLLRQRRGKPVAPIPQERIDAYFKKEKEE